MYQTFSVMRQLHESLWYLTDALTRRSAGPLHDRLGLALDETERLTHAASDRLLAVDMVAHCRDVDALLLAFSELVRAEARRGQLERSGADLIGADLRGADLRAADLRGAYLIGADLRGADLGLADVMAADFRNADLRGADVVEALFLTQSQLDAARGDGDTTFPSRLTVPVHWSPADPRPTRV
jgi:Pentapeptide repeats (8 copies)